MAEIFLQKADFSLPVQATATVVKYVNIKIAAVYKWLNPTCKDFCMANADNNPKTKGNGLQELLGEPGPLAKAFCEGRSPGDKAAPSGNKPGVSEPPALPLKSAQEILGPAQNTPFTFKKPQQ